MQSTLTLSEIAEPYAQALMSVAQSNNLTDAFGEDTKALQALLAESEDLKFLVTSPIIDSEKKKAVIRQILGEQIHPYMLNFLLLLVDRGRIMLLPQVCEQYQSLLRQLKQTVLAEVTSAVELTPEQQEAIKQKVMSTVQASQVELATRVDPDLLGGVIIKVGSQVFDASLRGQLRRIGIRLGAPA
ncbi:F0F1 ATP synthase subunit delta [Leptolyngbya sp. NK1-12]|uniref:ATP synthase subunit delta n=1 Tax=Leptolyngbya sp. NK1-12 TaxID=2547451 RepID=A0AA97AGZ1_9CYAN|nr:ATP synthase F1 subunit delta [Leptolyngbya sp. NK1-12]WNZ24855.1 F0F1 ATP synthase subunit delta [Leptolyngbya sp. NK1-12]